TGLLTRLLLARHASGLLGRRLPGLLLTRLLLTGLLLTRLLLTRLAGLRVGVADADDAHRESSAGVAGRLRELIFLLMHDQRPAEDRMRAAELELVAGHVDPGDALLVGLDVAEVANVAALLTRAPVRRALGREVISGRLAGLHVREVSVLVDVQPVLAGREPANLAGHANLVAFLLE